MQPRGLHEAPPRGLSNKARARAILYWHEFQSGEKAAKNENMAFALSLVMSPQNRESQTIASNNHIPKMGTRL